MTGIGARRGFGYYVTMDMPFFVRGLVLGFSIAAPVGPIGVLCLRRTLAGGRLYGLVSGLGAATADAVYGLIAGLGLTLAAQAMLSHGAWLRPAGGLFLCFLGLRTFLSRAAEHPPVMTGRGLAGAYLSTLALTLTNPLTILSFAAVFAGVGLVDGARSYGTTAALVLGVFVGSGVWWLLLTAAASLLRGQLGPGALQWINRAAGGMIMLFGVAALFGP
jgi:threonine/homoserine/homoserine lactone efflux protein